MNATRGTRRIVVALAAVLAVTACDGATGGGGAPASAGVTPAPAADKAGPNAAPVTLRLGTEDDEGRPGAQQIGLFAANVAELSGGQITIEPVWDANGDNNQGGWDQVVARMVVAGDLDMGMIPARAWDTEGVSTMRALHAPFLVTTDELSAAIAGGDLAGEMLAGLESIGITGLALAPESLRHLLTYNTTPATVGDFKDLGVRAPFAKTTYALFEALGAKPDDFTDPGETLNALIDAGLPAAAEASFALAGALPGGSTVIGNLPLFPKVNSLVINSEALGRLSDDQQDVLRKAAAKMVEQVATTMPDTVGYAEQFCRSGGTIVLADDALVTGLRRAVQPVYDDLERDATTKDLIERITALDNDLDAEPVAITPCSPTPVEPSPETRTSTPAEFPEGTYRKDVTLEELMDAGVDRPQAFEHSGIWTLTFRDGQYQDLSCPNSTYTVAEGRITVHLGASGEGCGDAAGTDLFSAGWILEGDELQLIDVRTPHAYDVLVPSIFGGRPFAKLD